MLNKIVKFTQKTSTIQKASYQFCSQGKNTETQNTESKKNNFKKNNEDKPKFLFGGFKTKAKQFPQRKQKHDTEWQEDNNDTSKTGFQFGANRQKQTERFQQDQQVVKNQGVQQIQAHSTQAQGQFLKFLDKDNQQETNQKQGKFQKKQGKKGQNWQQQQQEQEEKLEQQQQIQESENNKQDVQATINKIESLEKSVQNTKHLIELYAIMKDSNKVLQLFNELELAEQTEEVQNATFSTLISQGLKEAKQFLNDNLIKNQKLKIIQNANINAYIRLVISQEQIGMSKIEVAQELDQFLNILQEEEISESIQVELLSPFIQNLQQNSEIIQIAETFLNLVNYSLSLKSEQQIITETKKGQNQYYQINFDELFTSVNNYQYPSAKLTKNQKDLCLYILETAFKAGVQINIPEINNWLYTYFNQGEEGLATILNVANLSFNYEKILGKQLESQSSGTMFNQSQQSKKMNNYANKKSEINSGSVQSELFYEQFLVQIDRYMETHGIYPFNGDIVESQFTYFISKQQFISLQSLLILQNLAQKHNNSKVVFLIFHNYEKIRTSQSYEHFINQILNSELETNNYREVIQKVYQEARQQNINLSVQYKSISDVKAQLLENQYEEGVQIFEENFIKPNHYQHYKSKIKYFLMNVVLQQNVSVEYGISQNFINKFVNQLPNRLIQNLIESDQSYNNLIKTILGHVSKENSENESQDNKSNESMHSLRKNATLRQDFLYVRKQILNGQLSIDDLPKLKEQADQLVKNEIYILENYEKLNEEYQTEINLKKYMDDYHVLKEKYNFQIETSTPKNHENLTVRFNKEVEELTMLVNKLLNRKDDQSIEGEYAAYRKKRSTRSLYKLLNQITNQDDKSLKMKFINGDQLKEATVIFSDLYNQSDLAIQVKEKHISKTYVNEFCLWSIQNSQPIGVLLTENFYNIIGQQIPNHIARKIDQFYREVVYDNNGELSERQAKSMQLVQKVQRGKIYDLSQNYKHVQFDGLEEQYIRDYVQSNPDNRFKAQYLYFQDKTNLRQSRYPVKE